MGLGKEIVPFLCPGAIYLLKQTKNYLPYFLPRNTKSTYLPGVYQYVYISDTCH